MSTSEDRIPEPMEPKKFLFDLSFDDEVARGLSKKEKEKPTFSEEDLEAAKKEAYDSGMAAGKNTMLESQQQQMNLMLNDMEGKLKETFDMANENHAGQLTQMRKIALVIMRKLMPAYVDKYGFEEIEQIVNRTIEEMNQEPRLVIRVPESQFNEANERLNALAENKAYAGKLIILSDAELTKSDCRIEWADGGIERNQHEIWHEIDKALGMSDSSESTIPTPPQETPLAEPIIQEPVIPQEKPIVKITQEGTTEPKRDATDLEQEQPQKPPPEEGKTS